MIDISDEVDSEQFDCVEVALHAPGEDGFEKDTEHADAGDEEEDDDDEADVNIRAGSIMFEGTTRR